MDICINIIVFEFATTLTHLRYFFASHFFNIEYFCIIPKNLKRKCSRRSKTPPNIKNGWKLAKLSRKNRWVAVKFLNTVYMLLILRLVWTFIFQINELRCAVTVMTVLSLLQTLISNAFCDCDLWKIPELPKGHCV